MGQAYRLVRPQLTVDDIIRIRSRNDLRLTTSPFGITPEQYALNPPIYVGRAVGWKGAKGMEDFEKKVFASTDASNAAKIVAGLKEAIRISKKYAGVKGTVLYNGKLYPRKCIEQKKG